VLEIDVEVVESVVLVLEEVVEVLVDVVEEVVLVVVEVVDVVVGALTWTYIGLVSTFCCPGAVESDTIAQ